MAKRLNRPVQAFTAFLTTGLLLTACGGSGDADEATPSTPSDPRTPLAVTKAVDDGSEGTLRWAIERSNASAGTYRIVLTPPAGGLVIKPASELPALMGPARIEGPWTGSGEPTVVVDGSALYDTSVLNEAGNPTACPGQVSGFGANVRSLKNPGLAAIDTAKVEISGFEVRNFCSGIMLLRSKDNHVHHMRLVNNRGAAGVLVTGDAGDTAGSATSGLSINNIVEYNEFLNNSDSMDVARGSENTLIQFNTFKMDAQGIVPSQAIEILSSSNNKVFDNTATGFAEAWQFGGNNHEVARNTLYGNSIAFTMSGSGNRVYDNVIHGNRLGISTSGGANTLSRNRIWDQGKDISLCNAGGICSTSTSWLSARLGISLNRSNGHVENDLAAACADGYADCDTRQNHPVLTASTWQPAGFTVNGTLASRPSEAFLLEFFASHKPGVVNSFGEGEFYLGKLDARTDANGTLTFSYPTATTDPLKDGSKTVYFTVTATRVSSGQTSEFSQAVMVSGP